MVGTLASILLTLLVLVMLINLAHGTLPQWLAAKFLHRAPTAKGSLA